MSNRTLGMDDRLFSYFTKVSLRESELQRRLREETAQMPMARMQIAPEQGQFMALLVELLGAKKIVEVGTFTGYSALSMASALPEDGHLWACDVNEEWTDMGKRYWADAGISHKITLRLRPAAETLQALLDQGMAGQFDMAFLDADKSNYDTYYELCLQLLRPNGLIMVDNVLWGGSVADPTDQDEDTVAIRALNEKIRDDDRVSMSMVPIADGLTLARKR
ncbi:MAG: class I SAM-dependent methyltransferase [Myxococcales bacterium]|nr:class I SAM-dependent methyltransferase [Myxococcales bacterium]